MRAMAERASLQFLKTHRPVGFTSGELATFDGSAEPVVRELLQNSLDAADQANRSADVHFEIREVSNVELPGWKDYTQALSRAKCERNGWNNGEPSHDEKTVLDRIDDMCDRERLPLLLCVDNGHGLNPRRMDALLTPGNTSKGDQGAGSFGLGHHAAFGASSLRYVLYCSKYRDDGRVETIVSGHAILATHRMEPMSPWLAADGYWFLDGHTGAAFNNSAESYARTPPAFLLPYLDSLEDTGTVVCMAGFNDFNRDEGEPSSVEMICRVAAMNFSEAICSSRMTVSVSDRRGEAQNSMDLSLSTANDVEASLRVVRERRRAADGKAGHITGSTAYSALLTLRDGESIEAPEGIVIKWRRLDPSDSAQTQVHVYRRGMWITSRAENLLKSNFSMQEPFDAVLALNEGTLEALVRAAEGPEHRGLDMRRLVGADRKRLRQGLRGIADLLKEAVGERDDLQEYAPPGFAELEGQVRRAAEKVRRPRAPAGGGSSEDRVNRGKNPTNGETNKPRRRGTPTAGSMPRYRSSLRAGRGERVVTVHLAYDEEVADGVQIGVRLRSASGADGSCESPLPDKYLQIVSVEDDEGCTTRESSGTLEVLLPARAGRRVLNLMLEQPVDAPRLLELDLVRRRPPVEPSTPDEDDFDRLA